MTTTTTRPTESTGNRSQRWFAWLWKRLDASIDEAVEPAKDLVFQDLPNRIVEIGPGLGSNFKRYTPGTSLIAFEPNVYMHEGLVSAADRHGIRLDLRRSGVESMDLPDESQDVVVSSLTLCSVPERASAIAEIRRILAPGGRFLFVEHIAAPDRTFVARMQRVLRKPWAALADGCDLRSDVDTLLDEAGFSDVQRHVHGFGPIADPSRRTVYGYAVK